MQNGSKGSGQLSDNENTCNECNMTSASHGEVVKAKKGGKWVTTKQEDLFKQGGWQAKEFGTHSFWIGAATEGFRLAMKEGDLKRLGRWRSDCIWGYVQPPGPGVRTED